MKNYRWLLPVLLLQVVACSNLPPKATTEEPSEQQAQNTSDGEPEKEAAEIPTRPFPGDSFHDLLVAEFAVRRNRYDLALGNYLQQSHETRDTGVTARATRLAQFLRADKATLDTSLLWIELDPKNVEARYSAATILAKNKRPLEAMKHMVQVLEQGGKINFAAIAASALALPEDKRLELESAIDAQLVKHPQQGQLLTAKSLLLQQRNQQEQALSVIRDVLALNGDDLHAIIIEARLLQQLKREKEAFVRLEQVIQQHPKNRRLRLQYARMLMPNNIELAKKQFEILLTQSPNDADLLLSLGLINKETGHLEDAKTYFEQLLELGKRTNEAHYYLGQLSEHAKQWQVAIDHYKTISSGMDFLAATSRVSALYLKQGRVDTAQSYVATLRQQHPEHSVRLYLLESEILLGSHQLQAGNKLLTQALLVHPEQPSLLYARSVFSEKRQDYKLMEHDLRLIISQDNKNAVALNALGYVLANRSDRLEEAYQLILEALQHKPDDPAIIDSLGWVEYRRGNLQKAYELLKKAYTAYPDHEVAAHLGEVLWVLGQQQEAEKIWQQALKKTPNSAPVNETILRLTGKSPVLKSTSETSSPSDNTTQ